LSAFKGHLIHTRCISVYHPKLVFS